MIEIKFNKKDLQKILEKQLTELYQKKTSSQLRAEQDQIYLAGEQLLSKNNKANKDNIYSNPFAEIEFENNQKALEWINENSGAHFASIMEKYLEKGFDSFDKKIKKGTGPDSTSGIASNLYLYSQQYKDWYKTTAKGKREQEDLAIEQVNEYLRVYDELNPLIDETGNLVKDTVIGIKDLVKIIDSGIIVPIDKRKLTADYLANDDERAFANGRTKEENNENWKELTRAIANLTNIQFKTLSKEQENALKDLYSSVYSGDVNIEITKDGQKLLKASTDFSDALDNSSAQIEIFNTAYAKFFELFDETAPEVSKILKEFLATTGEKADRGGLYEDTHELTKDPYPLWQRIISNSLGVDLSLFKNP